MISLDVSYPMCPTFSVFWPALVSSPPWRHILPHYRDQPASPAACHLLPLPGRFLVPFYTTTVLYSLPPYIPLDSTPPTFLIDQGTSSFVGLPFLILLPFFPHLTTSRVFPGTLFCGYTTPFLPPSLPPSLPRCYVPTTMPPPPPDYHRFIPPPSGPPLCHHCLHTPHHHRATTCRFPYTFHRYHTPPHHHCITACWKSCYHLDTV